jgi:5-methylcytosine-specific restriction endonuclease McrA
MALKPCLVCGALSNSSRCVTHRKTTRRGYGWTHQQRARAAIAADPRCVDCGATQDLTADHIIPIAHGGNPLGPLQVLCRTCNSRRGAESW